MTYVCRRVLVRDRLLKLSELPVLYRSTADHLSYEGLGTSSRIPPMFRCNRSTYWTDDVVREHINEPEVEEI